MISENTKSEHSDSYEFSDKIFLPPSYFALSGFSVKRRKLRQTQIVSADRTVCVCFSFWRFTKAQIMPVSSIVQASCLQSNKQARCLFYLPGKDND
jgi:hypothetical protein